MKKLNLTSKKIFAILFSLFIVFYLITIGERFYRSSILNLPVKGMILSEMEYTADSEDSTDWSKIYPLKEEDSEISEPQEKPEEVKEISLIDSYKSKIETLESSIDYFTSKLLFLRMNFVELNSKFNKIIGMKLYTGSDTITALSDGSLIYYPYEMDMTDGIKNTAELSDFVKERDADFMYVQVPSKVDPNNNYLPAGVEDYDNQNADNLLEGLKEKGVDCLDLRDSMRKQKMNYSDAFYRTDHHWKTGVGLWAANEISKALESYGIEYKAELLSKDNYTEKVYKDFMFGSMGKQVTLSCAEPEDISIYTPDFDTDFSVDYYDAGTKSGNFTEALLDMSVLQKKDYYNTSTYSVYMYGVSPIVSIENKKADNDKRVLFICDSFSHCVMPYVATQVKYVDKLDLRYFNGSVKTFIEKTNPDVVIVMYYPGSFTTDGSGAMRLK